jgi:ankyrin repeat protein
VEKLIAKGVDVNAKDDRSLTALHWAAKEGRLDVVETLIRNGADVNVETDYGATALWLCASSSDNPEIARLLIKSGASVECRGEGMTPLIAACLHSKPNAARLLVESGARVNSQSDSTLMGKMTPLMAAAHTGRGDLVDLLLKAGADPSLKDQFGNTALTYATEQTVIGFRQGEKMYISPPQSNDAVSSMLKKAAMR